MPAPKYQFRSTASYSGANPNPTPAPVPEPFLNTWPRVPNAGAMEAPFDYPVGHWTDRYQKFIGGLPLDYIKSKLADYRSFAGLSDAQIRNLAYGYANQLGYVGSPSVTAAMKGPSAPPPANAIFPQVPQYNAPVTPSTVAATVTPTAKVPAPIAATQTKVNAAAVRKPQYNLFPNYYGRSTFQR